MTPYDSAFDVTDSAIYGSSLTLTGRYLSESTATCCTATTVYILSGQPTLAGFTRPTAMKWSFPNRELEELSGWREDEGSVGHEDAQRWSQDGPGKVFILKVGGGGVGG